MKHNASAKTRAAVIYGHKVSDAQKVLRYLAENDHLTRIQALGLFRIHNITARITELRQEGWRIETENCYDATGKRYARWRLHKDDASVVRICYLEQAA